MKLYMVPLAPNPTKVMLYIAEREALGASFGIEQIVVKVRALAAELGGSPMVAEKTFRNMIDAFIEVERVEHRALHGKS